MDKKRREFLKIAGISTLAGLGAPAIVDRFVSGSSPLAARAAREVLVGEPEEHFEKLSTEDPHETAADTAKKRYGMVINVRKFIDNPQMAEKCVEACHKVHNVPDFAGTKEEIKWIWLTGYENAFPEHSHYYRSEEMEENDVLVLCNHCDNPPCVRACPTKATFKMESNGIVAMDYHRCIGCRFCMAACPYGARSFNWQDPRKGLNMDNLTREFPTRMRGVVEKCNFCVERLPRGKEPACVEATGKTKAMVFGDLNDPNSEIRQILKENHTFQRKPSLGTYPSVFFII